MIYDLQTRLEDGYMVTALAVRACNHKSEIKNQKSRAFTLVELLVVITIIGILIALLLPAVQAAREAARRMQCSNNLKQLALAVLNYESSSKVLPPGAFWNLSNTTRKGSILLHLLPYVEQQSVYDAFDFHVTDIDGQCYQGTTNPIGATPIPAYFCPSNQSPKTFLDPLPADPSVAGITTVALHCYEASRGSNALYDNSTCSCSEVSKWNSYATTGPVPEPSVRVFSGPFTRLGVCLDIAEILDGLSNTIFFGEVLPMSSWHADNGWATTNDGNGYASTVIPINYDTSNRDAGGNNCSRYCDWNTADGFKSAHPGGAMFSYGDGSVHFLPESINHQTYQYLGGKADGNAVSGDF